METLFEKYRPSSFDEVLGQDKAKEKAKLLLSRSWGKKGLETIDGSFRLFLTLNDHL
jgi:hypothetical protein